MGDELWPGESTARQWSPGGNRLDTGTAHSARMYNFYLGGKDNYPADREAANKVIELFPSIRTAAQENRRFLGRAVRALAAELGVRQFLDIGTGLPTAGNTHEVAQVVAPDARIVYVDNDPLVMTHARALLRSTPEGATDYLEADLRDPKTILEGARQTLDFDQPIALMLVAILHFLPDADDPYGIVSRLVGELPAGSYLVLTHATGDYLSEETIARAASGPVPVQLRSRPQIAKFFDPLDLLPPGLVPMARWRAESESEPRPTDEETSAFAAVAKIP